MNWSRIYIIYRIGNDFYILSGDPFIQRSKGTIKVFNYFTWQFCWIRICKFLRRLARNIFLDAYFFSTTSSTKLAFLGQINAMNVAELLMPEIHSISYVNTSKELRLSFSQNNSVYRINIGLCFRVKTKRATTIKNNK